MKPSATATKLVVFALSLALRCSSFFARSVRLLLRVDATVNLGEPGASDPARLGQGHGLRASSIANVPPSLVLWALGKARRKYEALCAALAHPHSEARHLGVIDDIALAALFQ